MRNTQKVSSSRPPGRSAVASPRSSSSPPSSAFSASFLLEFARRNDPPSSGPPALLRGSFWSGPWEVEGVSMSHGHVWAVVRRGESVRRGGRAVAVTRHRSDALLVAATLPALAVPNHLSLGETPKRLGYPVHDGAECLGHVFHPGATDRGAPAHRAGADRTSRGAGDGDRRLGAGPDPGARSGADAADRVGRHRVAGWSGHGRRAAPALPAVTATTSTSSASSRCDTVAPYERPPRRRGVRAGRGGPRPRAPEPSPARWRVNGRPIPTRGGSDEAGAYGSLFRRAPAVPRTRAPTEPEGPPFAPRPPTPEPPRERCLRPEVT